MNICLIKISADFSPWTCLQYNGGHTLTFILERMLMTNSFFSPTFLMVPTQWCGKVFSLVVCPCVCFRLRAVLQAVHCDILTTSGGICKSHDDSRGHMVLGWVHVQLRQKDSYSHYSTHCCNFQLLYKVTHPEYFEYRVGKPCRSQASKSQVWLPKVSQGMNMIKMTFKIDKMPV